MKNVRGFIFVIVLLFGASSKAQLVYQEMGDLKMLANQKMLMVKYDYSQLMMATEETEEVYLEKKRAELNEKLAGRGDAFVERWNRSKQENWEVKFEELFNKYEKKIHLAQNHTDAEYTLVVKTLVVFPGYSIAGGFGGGLPSHITCDFIIVATNNPGVILSQSKIKHVLGSMACGYDDPGLCVQESFAKIAKVYSDHVKKNKK